MIKVTGSPQLIHSKKLMFCSKVEENIVMKARLDGVPIGVATPPMLAAINELGITGQLAHGLGFCFYTIASVVLASLCYYLAERPSQVLGRRLGGYVSGFAVIDKRQAT